MEGVSQGVPRFPPIHYKTSRPLMQMRWRGQREKNNMKGKKGHKRRDGRGEGLLKQRNAEGLFKSQQQRVSIKRSALTMLGQNK